MALLHALLEGGQVGAEEVIPRDVGVECVPSQLPVLAPVALEAVSVKVLQSHDCLHVPRVRVRLVGTHLEAGGHVRAKVAAHERILRGSLQVSSPAGVAHDTNIRRPAVEANVRQSRGLARPHRVVLSDTLEP